MTHLEMNKEKKPYKIGMPYHQAHYFKDNFEYIISQLFCGCYYSKLQNQKMKELLGELEIAYKNFVRFIEYQIETGYPFVFGQKDREIEEYWTIPYEGGYSKAIKFIDVLLSIHCNQINKGQTD